ncbi:MAG: alpha-amylase family glycosyl hydrolase [Cyclobacteriaceae bacterium]|nr:alpha-amylase family glycosyl hydrolase [Cyclobacteriaceae bacterium]
MKRYLFLGICITFLFFSCKDKPLPTPEPVYIPDADNWWNDDVFYEIYVGSFQDSDGNGIGDFQGLIQKLDYLNDGDPNTTTDLGVTGLWLMPIFPSPSYHGYDVTNYRKTNSNYGSLDDFKQLLDEAHQRGIKIVIDFVINHTSKWHPWFVNSSKGNTNEKRDWYVWKNENPGYTGPWGQTVWHENNGAYYYGVFWSGMPDLNYRNGEVTEEIKDIARYWYEDVGVDGFRIDAAPLLIAQGENQQHTSSTLSWWRNFYAFQKNIDPGWMTVGEVWDQTSKVVPYSDQRFDYCFEFDLAWTIINAANNEHAGALEGKMQEIVDLYPPLQYGIFLTNHDQNRVIEQLGGDLSKAKMTAGILLTLPGVPYMYYGEEVAMKGVKPDEDIRKPMQWDTGANGGFTTGGPWRPLNDNYTTFNVATMQADTLSLWHHYRKLIRARTESLPLRRGDFEVVDDQSPVLFTFQRTLDQETVTVVHNLSSSSQQNISLSLSGSDIQEGEYEVSDVLTGSVLGMVNVNSQGGYSGFSPFDLYEGQTTYVLKWEKK